MQHKGFHHLGNQSMPNLGSRHLGNVYVPMPKSTFLGKVAYMPIPKSEMTT